MGATIEVKDRTARTAAARWVDAATYKDNG
jgi:hypothetical protein